MGIFDKFKIGFKKSASALTSGLKEIIIKKEIDDKNLDKIEEFLIESDVGVEAASEIKEIISNKKIDPNKDLSTEINLILKEYIVNLMKPLENNSFFEKKDKLNATLISGVNGVGKTTTIVKIGKIFSNSLTLDPTIKVSDASFALIGAPDIGASIIVILSGDCRKNFFKNAGDNVEHIINVLGEFNLKSPLWPSQSSNV